MERKCTKCAICSHCVHTNFLKDHKYEVCGMKFMHAGPCSKHGRKPKKRAQPQLDPPNREVTDDLELKAAKRRCIIS